MASKAFILLLLCAQYFALNCVAMATSDHVNEEDILPTPPRRLVFAALEPKVDVKAEFTLQMEGVNITNVTIFHRADYGGTTTITSGGAGYDFVSIVFGVQKGIEVYNAFVYIYTDDFPSLPEDAEELFTTRKSEFNPRAENVNILMASKYNVKDEDRRENFTIQFKDGNTTLQDCWGTSHWMNGNGTTEIYGGIEENYFEVVSHIPAGIYGDNLYECQPMKPNTKQTVDLLPVEDDTMTHHYQFYGTIQTEVPNSERYLVNSSSTIVAMDGDVVWKSDIKGEVDIVGGVGSNFLQVIKTEGGDAYGYFQYNVTSES